MCRGACSVAGAQHPGTAAELRLSTGRDPTREENEGGRKRLNLLCPAPEEGRRRDRSTDIVQTSASQGSDLM